MQRVALAPLAVSIGPTSTPPLPVPAYAPLTASAPSHTHPQGLTGGPRHPPADRSAHRTCHALSHSTAHHWRTPPQRGGSRQSRPESFEGQQQAITVEPDDPRA